MTAGRPSLPPETIEKMRQDRGSRCACCGKPQTLQEIADRYGVSVGAVFKYTKARRG